MYPSPWSHRKKVPKTVLTLFLVSGVHFGFARILRRSSVVTDSDPSGLSFRIVPLDRPAADIAIPQCSRISSQ